MQGSVQSLCTWARCRSGRTLGVGTAVSLLALLTLNVGCPFIPPSDTTVSCTVDADCDDGQACINEVCEDVECVDATDCDDNVVCTDDVCDATAHTCSNTVDPDCCTVAADCDDGEACTADACEADNTCSNTVDPDCCEVAADCDDSNECTDEACTAGACVITNNDANLCDDGVDCTDSACVAGVCTGTDIAGCCTSNADCLDSESCDTLNNVCVPNALPCAIDDDCDNGNICDGLETCNDTTLLCEAGTALPFDDGVFCNGAETCDPILGTQDGADPCNATIESCDEDNLECDPIVNLILTEGLDILTGSAANEVVFGNDATYTSGDQVNALGGVDTLELILEADEDGVVTMTELELLFIRNNFAAQDLSISDFTGYTQIWYDRGEQDLTLNDALILATVGITGGDGSASDFTVEFDNLLTDGAADAVSVALDGADAGDLTLEAFEVFNVDVTGDNELDALVSADLETVNITGGSTLLINTAIGNATTVDASGSSCDVEITADNVDFTYLGGMGVDIVHFGAGEFTDDDSMDGGIGVADELVINLDANINNPVTVLNTEILSAVNSAAVTIDLDGTTGIATIRMEYQNDTDALTFDNLGIGPNLVFRGDGNDADQDFNSVVMSFADAAGSADSQSIEFNNRGDDGEELDTGGFAVDVDTIDIDDIESVSIAANDGGATTIQTLNGAEIEGLTLAVETEDGTLAIVDVLESTVVTSVDAAASLGGVSVSIANSTENATLEGGEGVDTLTGGEGEDDITGGAGNDVLDGGPGDAIDVIDGGADDDTINGGFFPDELTGGAGSDTFVYDADNDDAADADTIDGFTPGSSGDVISIEVANAGGGVAPNLSDANFAANGIVDSANNTFIVDSDQASNGYATVTAAIAAVEADTAGTTEFALMFFNTGASRVELYIHDDSTDDVGNVLLCAFEDIDNLTDARAFLDDVIAANFNTF